MWRYRLAGVRRIPGQQGDSQRGGRSLRLMRSFRRRARCASASVGVSWLGCRWVRRLSFVAGRFTWPTVITGSIWTVQS
jgi:hypothetical protein